MLKNLSKRLKKLLRFQPESIEEIKYVLRGAESRGIFDPRLLFILEGALSVSQMKAREIMVPRNNMVVIPIESTSQEILKIIITATHSRYPVIGDSIDDFKGILHAKDLLPLAFNPTESEKFEIENYVRSATKYPESIPLNRLLQEFQQKKKPHGSNNR